LTEKEQSLENDLNNAWMSYFNKNVKFPEMIKLYMKIGYSVNGFMEVYHECFLIMNPKMKEEDYNGDDDMMDDRVVCESEDIRKIILGEIPPFNKHN
jgi:hypothetical protein